LPWRHRPVRCRAGCSERTVKDGGGHLELNSELKSWSFFLGGDSIDRRFQGRQSIEWSSKNSALAFWNHLCSITFSSNFRQTSRSVNSEAVTDFDKLSPLSPCFTTFNSPSCPSDALFPSSTSWAPLRNDLSIISVSHITRISFTNPRYHK
jgi:hypothetical protein